MGGCCDLGRYGGRPSFGVCLQCEAYDGPARGAGDTVAKFIKATTFGKVKPCGGCKKRRRKLNELVSYGNGNR
jgi:hypothetical protein